MAELGAEPSRIVIELTEDYPTFDFPVVHESLMLYRSMGFRIAIDDLGEGFASLRLWSELRPEFVKADKHFVTGLSNDPVKAQFLRAIQDIAESAGSQVIAEGIETAADFKVVRDMLKAEPPSERLRCPHCFHLNSVTVATTDAPISFRCVA